MQIDRPKTYSMDAENTNFEDQLPAVQKWFNGFFENWIFAFIVAMVIRQFFLEPFVIPTASMEPMLLGSMRWTEADHVVVNKFTHRFTDAQRWDVTVFEFPIPEVKKNGHEVRLWGLSKNELEANWLSSPLQHRNFVKRMVVLPGDEFYVSGGDVYIKDGDVFDVARKPIEVQEALWQNMYTHGIEDDYLPWSSGAKLVDGEIHIKPGQLPIYFKQPLINLYMKPGLYRVHNMKNMAVSANLNLSMEKPRFQLNNVKGNIWDLKGKWAIYRLKSKELDSKEHGSMLNRQMTEFIGDIRVRFQISDINGSVQLQVTNRDQVRYILQLLPKGWQVLRQNGEKEELLFQGQDDVIDKSCAFVHLDNQVWFELDGKVLHEKISEQAPKNPDAACTIKWGGKGSLRLKACAVDRDVHYTKSGFLTDLRRDVKLAADWRQRLSGLYGPTDDEALRADKSPLALAYKESMEHHQLRHGLIDAQILVRERLLGHTPNSRESRYPIGNSPKNALTAPDNAYLMFGDNSPFSWDSRDWGWVPGTNIRGRAAWVVLPIKRWKGIR